jgi:DNA primase
MQDAKEEVRARLNIEDVIGEYVQLKRAGRNFKGLSPFSGEKTPSFFVSPDKHIWHDFSSNKGGDVFSFVMEVEGMDFRQALEHLARRAGVDMTKYETKGNQELSRRKKRSQQALDLAASYYQHSLLKNDHALEYVFKIRGLGKRIVEQFRIGYAPDSGDALVQFLGKKGFSRGELADAGLTNRFGGDMFRGRMTVPLMDPTGQVVGFTARILTSDPNAPKYLNTPQTLLYDKGRHVFGLSQAKEAIRTNDYAVIVEGNLDVVSSHQAGVTAVVATAGTALTDNHLRALRRLTGNIRLAFDGDKAGISATERAIPIASEVGVELTIITLPEGAKDPDELIQQDVSLWQLAINSAQPAVDWILDQYSKKDDLTTASGKRTFTTAALEIVKGLRDSVEREHYEKKIAQMVGTSLESIRAKRGTKPQEKPLRSVSKNAHAGGYTFDHVDTLLGLAMQNPRTRDLFAHIDPQVLRTDEQRRVFGYLIKHPADAGGETPKELQNIDDYVTIILLRAEKRYDGWNDDDQYFEAAKLLRQLQTEHAKTQLETQIASAEEQGDISELERLRQEHYKLIKEMKRA